MHNLFLAFLCFVSYATGVVMVQRWCGIGHRGSVHLLELLLAVAVVSFGVFLGKPHYSMKYLALCLSGMFFFGVSIGSGMLLGKKQTAAGTGEYIEGSGETANLSLWKKWLNSSRAVVDYEFRLLLLACYLLIIGPFAIVFRFSSGTSSRKGMGSAWLPRSDDVSPDAAGRPF
jgi:hypothetical protein